MLKSKTLMCEKELNDLVGVVGLYETKSDALIASKAAGWGRNVTKIEFRFMCGWCVAQITQGRLYLFVKSGVAPVVLDATPKTASKQTENDFGRFTFTLDPAHNGTSEIEVFPDLAAGCWIIRSKNGPNLTIKARGKYINDVLMTWGGYRIET